jgi:hydroxysqualene dehydroxylase
MMGCYARTLAFLERIGAGAKVYRQADLRVPFLHRERGAGAIACRPLPGPLHVMGGILGYRLLTRGERLRALVAGVRLMTMRRGDDPRLRRLTVDALLVELGQSARAREAFWNPVAIATLNEDPTRAAAAPFVEVLARAFFGSRRDSQFVLPRVGLSDLYTDDARRFIESRGGRVRARMPVASLATTGDRVDAVTLRDGERLGVDACIAALPPRALGPLLPDGVRATLPLDRFETSPIVSTHVWLDRPVLAASCRPFVGLLGTATHWLFDRSALVPDGGEPCVSAVMSAAAEAATWEPTRIADTVVGDMRALLPAARAAVVRRTVVVKEKHATIAVTPETERLRPGPETAIPNLALAGDWTATGLPPTIESAVVSGERAAAVVAARLWVC